MPLEGGDIVLPVKLSTEEAEQLWAQLKEKLERNPPKVPPPAPPSPDVPKGWKGLTDRIFEYRSEQLQSNRATRFFANELASLVPGMNTASASMRSLVGVALEGATVGLGFGLAMEAVKAAVQIAGEESERSAKRLAAYLDAVNEVKIAQLQAAARSTEATRQETAGQKAFREEMEHLNPVVAGLQEKMQKLKDEGPGFWAQFKAGIGVVSAMEDYTNLLEAYDKQIGKAILSAKEWAEVRRAEAQERQRAGQAAPVDKTLGERESQIMAQRKALAREAELIGMDERQKIAQQLAFQIQDLRAFGASDAETRRAIASARKIAAEKDHQALMAEWAKEQEAASAYRQKGYDSALAEAKANMEKLRAARALAAGLDPNDQTKVREDLALLDEVAAKYRDVAGVLEMVEKAKSRIVQTESQKRMQQWREEHEFQAIALDMTASMVGRQFAKMATHAGAYDRAMQAAGKSQAATADEMIGAALAWTQEVLAAIAQQAAVKAIFALAEGYLALATPGLEGKAPAAFAAAATYGLVGGAAAAAGYAIGEMRPMTQEERGQVEGGSSAPSSSQRGSASGGSSSVSGSTAGWRDAGVDMSDRRPAQVINNFYDIRAIDVQSFEQAYRRSADGVLRVNAEWKSAGRSR